MKGEIQINSGWIVILLVLRVESELLENLTIY